MCRGLVAEVGMRRSAGPGRGSVRPRIASDPGPVPTASDGSSLLCPDDNSVVSARAHGARCVCASASRARLPGVRRRVRRTGGDLRKTFGSELARTRGIRLSN